MNPHNRAPHNDPAPHGSPAGHTQGCRTRAMCPHGEDSVFLSCTEAAIRRRADYHLAHLPDTQPLPRHVLAEPATPSETAVREVHGTPWGYARGCRDTRTCPNWARGGITCPEARRRYMQTYTARRAAGTGTPIEHGTSNGYLLGCRNPATCPRNPTGHTCTDARSRYRQQLARAAGIAPRTESIDARAAATRIRELRALGLSLRHISTLTGTGRTTIAQLTGEGRTTRTRITPTTLDRILAIDTAALTTPDTLTDAHEPERTQALAS
ncbi:hypothetical protein ACIPY5_03140 [Microbacterium sp. NPDC089698]|uniref:hypothetical protein n=1 Tax=Microbacterium sp. NPDC089698 TaxID=3364200 RepID=UPI00382F43EF